MEYVIGDLNLLPERKFENAEVKNSNRTVTELLKDNELPILFFERRIYEELQYIAEKLLPNREFAAFLILKTVSSNRPNFKAVDFYIPKQEAGYGGVKIDAEDSEEYFKKVADLGVFPDGTHRHIAHLHSHNSMGCFWSSVDTNQQNSRDDLGYYDDYRVFAVINTKREIRAAFVTYFPVLHRYDNIPVVISGEFDEISEERKDELKRIIDEQLEPLTSSVFEGEFRAFSEFGESDMSLLSYRKEPDWFGRDYGYWHGDGFGTEFGIGSEEPREFSWEEECECDGNSGIHRGIRIDLGILVKTVSDVIMNKDEIDRFVDDAEDILIGRSRDDIEQLVEILDNYLTEMYIIGDKNEK